MSNNRLARVPALLEGVLLHEVEGSGVGEKEAMIVLPSKHQIKVVNEVGAFVLRLVDGQRTVRQIVEFVHEAYAAPLEQIEQDVVAFLEQLAAKGVITLKEG